MKKLSLGIIGCSSVAKRRFLPALKQSKLVNLKIIGSRSLEKAERWANEYMNCEFGTYGDVLKSDVDIVYISIPIGLHEEWIIKCANAKKHIICEKSSTSSYKSAKRIISECRKNKIRIIENFSFVYHPQHLKISNYVQNGIIGKPSLFFGIFIIPPPIKSDIRWNKKLGGGALNDVTCYPIFASRMIFQSEPLGVYSSVQYDKNSKVDIKNIVYLSYPNKKNAFIQGGYDTFYQSKYSVYGSIGNIHSTRAYSIEENMKAKLILEKNKIKNKIEINSANQLKSLINVFCKSIYDKKNNRNRNFEKELLNQSKIMEAIRLSQINQKFVRLSQIK